MPHSVYIEPRRTLRVLLEARAYLPELDVMFENPAIYVRPNGNWTMVERRAWQRKSTLERNSQSFFDATTHLLSFIAEANLSGVPTHALDICRGVVANSRSKPKFEGLETAQHFVARVEDRVLETDTAARDALIDHWMQIRRAHDLQRDQLPDCVRNRLLATDGAGVAEWGEW